MCDPLGNMPKKTLEDAITRGEIVEATMQIAGEHEPLYTLRGGLVLSDAAFVALLYGVFADLADAAGRGCSRQKKRQASSLQAARLELALF